MSSILLTLLLGSVLVILLIMAQNACRPATAPEPRWRYEQTLPRAELRVVRRWPCPACGRPFGKASVLVRFTVPESVYAFKSQVSAVCGHCGTMNIFDQHGHHGIEHGLPRRPFDPPRETDEEMAGRFARLAREVECPLCGSGGIRWSGHTWGSSLEPIAGATERGPIFRATDWIGGPILRCEDCGGSACFRDRDDRLEFDRSPFDGR